MSQNSSGLTPQEIYDNAKIDIIAGIIRDSVERGDLVDEVDVVAAKIYYSLTPDAASNPIRK